MTDPSEIAKAFVGHYYQTYQTNPDALAGLYVSSGFVSTDWPELDSPRRNTNAARARSAHLALFLSLPDPPPNAPPSKPRSKRIRHLPSTRRAR